MSKKIKMYWLFWSIFSSLPLQWRLAFDINKNLQILSDFVTVDL